MRKKYLIKNFLGDPLTESWYDIGLYDNGQEIYPKNGDDIEIDLKKETNQEFERYFIEDEIIIYHNKKSDDFKYLANKLYSSATKESPRIFEIQTYDGEKWNTYWDGLINVKTVDFYKKEISINVDVVDEYSRFINDQKKERNIYDVTPVSVRLPQPTWVEFYHKLVLKSTSGPPSPGPTLPTGYVTFRLYSPGGDPNYKTSILFPWSYYAAREAIMYPEGYTPDGTGWVELPDSEDNGMVKWVRSYYYEWPDLLNTYLTFSDGCNNGAPVPPASNSLLVYSRCPAIVPEQKYSAWTTTTICSGKTSFRYVETPRGRLVYDVLRYFAQQFSLDFQSIFFSSSNDPVTGELQSVLQGAMLIQNTDFKYPASDEPAKDLKITWEKLMNGLSMFQVAWDIIGDKLVVEHLKWFENKGTYSGPPQLGLTLISGKNQYNQKYTVKQNELYRYEKLTIPGSDGEDFKGVPIEYISPMVNQSESETKEYNTEFYTDVYYLNFNRSALPDSGFILLSTQTITGFGTTIINENGEITGELISNGPFSVANLQERYWKYRRIFEKGKLNNILTTFETWQKNSLQEDLIIDDCVTVVDPRKLIRTRLGDGEFESMNIKLKTGFKRLTIKLDI